jgi:hypothetical protein
LYALYIYYKEPEEEEEREGEGRITVHGWTEEQAKGH